MEVLENKIAEAAEELTNLTPGSEEYLNQSKSISEMVTANSKDKEIALESKYKKIGVVFSGITAVGGILAAIGTLLTPVLRRFSNKDWIRAEDEGFYVQNKDNR